MSWYHASVQMEDCGVMNARTALIAQHAGLAVAGPVGSFDAYLERVSRIPVLDREHEQQLAQRFRRDNDLDAARELVLSHLRFVVHIARGYAGYGLPMNDLVQEAPSPSPTPPSPSTAWATAPCNSPAPKSSARPKTALKPFAS